MKKDEKLSLEEMIKKIDDSKKVNPMDLSSDQDLTIALMNLISLEEHFFFSGAKTEKTGFYEMMDTIREMRKELMAKVVKKDSEGEIWCISKHLLAASMRLMEVGTKANCGGNKAEAHNLFGKAYDLYSLFWGLNMDLVDLGEVKKLIPDMTGNTYKPEEKKEFESVKTEKTETTNKDSLVHRLGCWVKNSVNCCIE